MYMRCLCLFVCFLSVLALPASARLRVIATTSIVGDWVYQVAGEDVELDILAEAGADAHTFELSPRDVALLEQADIIFENGWGLEEWLEVFKDKGDIGGRVVSLCESVEAPIQLRGHGGAVVYDPHFWMDVQNAKTAAAMIRDALEQKDPKGAATYRVRANAYLKELEKLDQWILETIGGIAKNRRLLVTQHWNVRYFTKRYDLREVGVLHEALSSDVPDPAASQFARLIGQVKRLGVPAVFVDAAHNNELMARLAEETDLPEPYVLYVESLGFDGINTYIKMMRTNTQTLQKALK